MKKTGFKPPKDRLAAAVPNVNNVRVNPGQSNDSYAANRPAPKLVPLPVGRKGSQK